MIKKFFLPDRLDKQILLSSKISDDLFVQKILLLIIGGQKGVCPPILIIGGSVPGLPPSRVYAYELCFSANEKLVLKTGYIMRTCR